jgi:hypothetical protein
LSSWSKARRCRASGIDPSAQRVGIPIRGTGVAAQRAQPGSRVGFGSAQRGDLRFHARQIQRGGAVQKPHDLADLPFGHGQLATQLGDLRVSSSLSPTWWGWNKTTLLQRRA